MTRWPISKLGDQAVIVMGQSPPGDTYNTEGRGLPFFQGKAEFGHEYPEPTKWCDSPLKIAEPGDVLLSVRAPVGPTNVARERCCIGRGLAAIRPRNQNLYARFLRHFFTAYESQIAQKGAGSTFDAIGRAVVEALEIPVPPLPEQERIVRILDEAEALRRLRAQADARTSVLESAFYEEMFGTPDPEWPQDLFGNLGNLDRGRSKHRPRDEPALFGGPYPFIQTGEVANSGGRITGFSQAYSEAGLAQSKLWPAGTLCITIAANIAKTGVLCFDACFPDSVVGFTPGERVTVEYVQAWLSTLQTRLEEEAPQAAQKNINLKILRELSLVVPPLEIQRAFAARVAEIRELETAQTASHQRLDDLFQSLLHRAFQGDL